MSRWFDGLPNGLAAKSISSHKLSVWGREETVLNHDESRFVVGFDIHEHTMMNDMGLFAWGDMHSGKAVVSGFIARLWVYCWQQPFVSWVSPSAFVFKTFKSDGYYPLIALDFHLGWQTLAGLDQLESRPAHATQKNLAPEMWQPHSLLNPGSF